MTETYKHVAKVVDRWLKKPPVPASPKTLANLSGTYFMGAAAAFDAANLMAESSWCLRLAETALRGGKVERI